MLSETVDSLLDCALIPETPVRITPYRLMNWAPLVGWNYNGGCCLRGADDGDDAQLGVVSLGRLGLTERARLVGPRAEAAGDEMRDDVADVALLRRLVVGACIVAGDCHGPAALALLQLLQEPRGVVDVPSGIEHRPHRGEFVAVIVMIDLHAAEVDQLDPPSSHGFEVGDRVVHVLGEYGLSVGAERVRVKCAAPPGLGQADRVENAERNSVLLGRTRHLALARARIVGRSSRGAGVTDKQGRDESAAPRLAHDASPGWTGAPVVPAWRRRRLVPTNCSYRRTCLATGTTAVAGPKAAAATGRSRSGNHPASRAGRVLCRRGSPPIASGRGSNRAADLASGSCPCARRQGGRTPRCRPDEGAR